MLKANRDHGAEEDYGGLFGSACTSAKHGAILHCCALGMTTRLAHSSIVSL